MLETELKSKNFFLNKVERNVRLTYTKVTKIFDKWKVSINAFKRHLAEIEEQQEIEK